MEQRTDEWFAARLGKVTASKIADVMATLKSGGPSAMRVNYAAQLLCERLTGQPTESFTNAAMQWGTDTEPRARAAYEFLHGVTVTETGFVDHPSLAAGASPDGLVNDDGLVEIKCPNTATHFATLEGAKIDRKYLLQMQWQMACTGRQWCDFASYDPRVPLPMQLHVERVVRDDNLIAEIEAEVGKFLTELDEREAALRARYEMKEAA